MSEQTLLREQFEAWAKTQPGITPQWAPEAWAAWQAATKVAEGRTKTVEADKELIARADAEPCSWCGTAGTHLDGCVIGRADERLAKVHDYHPPHVHPKDTALIRDLREALVRRGT